MPPVVFPSIQELRYGGRRLIEALNKIEEGAPEDEIRRLLADAEFDCHRAQHDAIDAATSKIALDIEAATKKLGYDPVLKAFPDLSDLFTEITIVRDKVADSRENRDDRDKIYSVIEKDHFTKIIKLYDKFRSAEPIMRGLAKSERRNRGIGYLLTVTAIVIAIITFFSK